MLWLSSKHSNLVRDGETWSRSGRIGMRAIRSPLTCRWRRRAVTEPVHKSIAGLDESGRRRERDGHRCGTARLHPANALHLMCRVLNAGTKIRCDLPGSKIRHLHCKSEHVTIQNCCRDVFDLKLQIAVQGLLVQR